MYERRESLVKTHIDKLRMHSQLHFCIQAESMVANITDSIHLSFTRNQHQGYAKQQGSKPVREPTTPQRDTPGCKIESRSGFS